ncbi:hypothetical protein JI752_001390 [Lysobacter sp. MMG2]|nr:hypothetical protein [Lysobacter sp. MMG2]
MRPPLIVKREVSGWIDEDRKPPIETLDHGEWLAQELLSAARAYCSDKPHERAHGERQLRQAATFIAGLDAAAYFKHMDTRGERAKKKDREAVIAAMVRHRRNPLNTLKSFIRRQEESGNLEVNELDDGNKKYIFYDYQVASLDTQWAEAGRRLEAKG